MPPRVKSVSFKTVGELPTFIAEEHRGVLMWDETDEALYVGGAAGWELLYSGSLDPSLFVTTTGVQTLTNKTIDTADNDITVLRSDVTDFYKTVYATYGPFFANDIVGTGTQSLQAAFFDTATTVSRSTPDVYLASAGEVIGISMISDSNRTAGTATAELLINGSVQTFDGGAVCVLDGTNTRRHAVMVNRGDGEDFSAGNRAALQITTSGWTPTTANIAAWFTVRFDLA